MDAAARFTARRGEEQFGPRLHAHVPQRRAARTPARSVWLFQCIIALECDRGLVARLFAGE